jgi:ribosomal protein S18 acetylase RimI-like enzyme
MIRKACGSDCANIISLYKAVAGVPDGIARTPEEVTEAYVSGFMHKAAADGVEFVCEEGGRIVGEIHASRTGIACLSSLLTDLTIAVHPEAQGRGVGRRLFEALIAEVTLNMPHIVRIELFARVSNERARGLYASLGFVEEGRLPSRVRNAQGLIEADTVMGWLRPGWAASPA